MFFAAVGHSDDPDTSEALGELLEQFEESLAGHSPQAGILFAAIDFDHQLLINGISDAFPGINLIGCTTDGEISDQMGFQQDSVTLTLFCSDEVEIRAGVGRTASEDPGQAAKDAVQMAQQDLTLAPALCLTTPEGLTVSPSALIESLSDLLGTVPILGGVAAEKPKAESTYQFIGREVLKDSIPILLFAGNLLFSHGFSSGWQPIGKESVVTKAHQNIVYEIDHEPAINLYHYYFNEFAPDVAYPLAVFPPGEDRYFLRGAASHDPEKGSLAMAGAVPTDSKVQITEAEQEHILTAAQSSFKDARESYPGQDPAVALFFSCAWRRWVLGTQTGQEFSLIQEQLQGGLPCSGFYTFGEIAPLSQAGQAFCHNTTFVTLLMGTK